MKLLLPLLAVTLFVTACSSTDAPRRPLWASVEPTYLESGKGGRQLWGPENPIGYSDPNATRRDLYSPNKASGPYTNQMNDGSWRYGGKTVDEEMKERREEQRLQRMINPTPAQPPAT